MDVWKGNDVPIFKGNEKNTKNLEDLLNSCEQYQYHDIGFNKDEMRKYVMKIFAERRRRKKGGTDFDKVSVSKIALLPRFLSDERFRN